MSAVHLHEVSSAAGRQPIIREYLPPQGLRESVAAAVMRMALRVGLKPFLGPPWPIAVQRFSLAAGSMMMPQDGRAQVRTDRIGPISADRVTPKSLPKAGGKQPRHAILFLHGGAFLVGSPRTHRSITRRLCALTGAEVLVPDYRLAPEARFPTQIEDCLLAYKQLLADGYPAERIAIAGDSAGGHLTYMTSIAAREAGLPQPAALCLISPALSIHPFPDTTANERAPRDPMIRLNWVEDIERGLCIDPKHRWADALAQDLSALPPSLIQTGDDEVLFDNSTWLVKAATAAGRHSELEIYLQRWHVFQAHVGIMESSNRAVQRMADFMQQHWAA
jgi:epsilon-lactone hydrolase